MELGAEGGRALELRAARGGVGLGGARPSLERCDRRVALRNLARRLLSGELLAAGGVVALAQLLFGARERRRPLREMLLQLRLEELECDRLLLGAARPLAQRLRLRLVLGAQRRLALRRRLRRRRRVALRRRRRRRLALGRRRRRRRAARRLGARRLELPVELVLARRRLRRRRRLRLARLALALNIRLRVGRALRRLRRAALGGAAAPRQLVLARRRRRRVLLVLAARAREEHQLAAGLLEVRAARLRLGERRALRRHRLRRHRRALAVALRLARRLLPHLLEPALERDAAVGRLRRVPLRPPLLRARVRELAVGLAEPRVGAARAARRESRRGRCPTTTRSAAP